MGHLSVRPPPSFGSPADSESPVALRPYFAAGLPVREAAICLVIPTSTPPQATRSTEPTRLSPPFAAANPSSKTEARNHVTGSDGNPKAPRRASRCARAESARPLSRPSRGPAREGLTVRPLEPRCRRGPSRLPLQSALPAQRSAVLGLVPEGNAVPED